MKRINRRFWKPVSLFGLGDRQYHGTYVLSFAPLSRDFRRQLGVTTEGDAAHLTLTELRGMGTRPMLRFLRRLRAVRVVIAFQDANEMPLAPLLLTLATLADTRIMEMVYPDLRRRRITRWHAVPAAARVLFASIDGVRALHRCRAEVRQLSAEPRLDALSMRQGPVLYVKPSSAFGVVAGGSVGHSAGVVNAFVHHGFTVDFVAPHVPVMLDPQVRTYQARSPATCAMPAEANYYRLSRSLSDQAYRRALQAPPSFVYARPVLGDYSGVTLSRRLGVPLVLEYNGSEVWVAGNWASLGLHYPDVAKQAEEVCLRHAHVVVTVSEVLRDELIGRGVDPEDIVCYPNCIDPTVFDPARFDPSSRRGVRSSNDIADDATVVTFVGTFGRWHGTDVLAHAVKEWAEGEAAWLERNRVHFLIVGDGQMMPQVRAILAGEQCRRFVSLTGLIPQAEAPRYLAASDIVVAPHIENPDGSRFFGSPTKLFEYMAMGKGIVASDLDQIGDVLRNSLRVEHLPTDGPGLQETALAVLTRPGSAEDLMRGVRFLVEHPHWRAVIGANARQRALQRYTWDRHVGTILAGLARVVHGSGDHGGECVR